MKVIKKEIQYSENSTGTMYCIKDDRLYIFTLDNHSFSVSVESSDELREVLKYENLFQTQKEDLIKNMQEMIQKFDSFS